MDVRVSYKKIEINDNSPIYPKLIEKFKSWQPPLPGEDHEGRSLNQTMQTKVKLHWKSFST